MAYEIYPQDDGTFKIRAWAKSKDSFGKRKTKQKSGFKSATVAKREAIILESELSEERDTEIKFSKLEALYVDARSEKMSPTTIENLSYVRPRILEFFGHRKAKDITTGAMQSYVDAQEKRKNTHTKQPIRAGTIQRDMRHINAVLNWGVKREYLEYNRVKSIELPEDEEEFEPTVLPPEKLGEVLAYIKQNNYNLYIPVLLSAASNRRGESLGIKLNDIDFENDILTIKNNRVQTKAGVIDRNKLKSKKLKKVTTLSEFVKNELLEHLEKYADPDSEYVCSNVFIGEPPTPSYITTTFSKIMKKKFGIKMRLHDLRTSFNAAGRELGVDETTRSEMLGHADVKTTRKYYTPLSLKKNKEGMEAIFGEVEKSFLDAQKKTSQ